MQALNLVGTVLARKFDLAAFTHSVVAVATILWQVDTWDSLLDDTFHCCVYSKTIIVLNR